MKIMTKVTTRIRNEEVTRTIELEGASANEIDQLVKLLEDRGIKLEDMSPAKWEEVFNKDN